MIKFRSTKPDGSQLIGLGLSDGNIEKLKAGQPIVFDFGELGIEGFEGLIMYGKTEEDIITELDLHGVKLPSPEAPRE